MELCWEDLKKVACLQHCPQRPRSCFHLQDIFSHLLKVLRIQTQPLSTLLNLYLIRSDPSKKKLGWLLNNKKKLFVGKKDYILEKNEKGIFVYWALRRGVLFTNVASILALKKLSLQKSELFILFAENSQTLIKISVIFILFHWSGTDSKQPTQLIVQLNSSLRHIIVSQISYFPCKENVIKFY